MLIQNDPIDADAILKLALAYERSGRIARIEKWVFSADIVVEEQQGGGVVADPNYVALRCGDITFTEERESFPTVKLVADIALAIQAGYSCRASVHHSHPGYYYYYGSSSRWAQIAEDARARVTAAVMMAGLARTKP